jgi:peptide/nickel transport system substrate-binding protein
MKQRRVALAAVCAIALTLAACSSKRETPKAPAFPLGGILRLALPATEGDPSSVSYLDPQFVFEADVFAFARCCLLRTLLTVGGRPTREGGAELHPDLARRLPNVSADGLTWTFSIKPGLKYAPPLQTTEITAADFVRALQRTAKLGSPKQGGYSNYFSVIQGFDQYARGEASSIAGAQTPDPHTLVIHLTHGTGDLDYRFSMPATAPIPPSPSGAPFGAADGHDKGYGRFLVASGPYMIKGSDGLQISPGAAPLSGVTPKQVTFVRNPSWTRDSDSQRPAYVDEIDLKFVDDIDAAGKAIDDGTADLAFVTNRPPQAPLEQIARYRANATLGRVEINRRDLVRYISMNLALPPFDDVHVRKAMNLIVDKAALNKAIGGPLIGDTVGHIALDSSEHNLLVNYDPYRTPGDAGSVDLAKAEMKQSRYDRNHDGLCDAAACKKVSAYYFGESPVFTGMAPIVRSSAAKIGIALALHGSPTFFDDVKPIESKIALSLFPGWGKDYLNPSNFFEPLFASSAIGIDDWSFTGASADQLRKAGYRTTTVPSVDDRIADCLERLGRAQLDCWAGLDQYLMETVVPWIPFLAENTIQVVPARIAHYSFDQAQVAPAPEQIALKR